MSKFCQVRLNGTTTKNAIEYKIGQEIVFKLHIETNDVSVPYIPYIKYLIKRDGDETVSGFAQQQEDGCFYVSTTLNCPGFAYLQAFACDQSKQIIESIAQFDGGAGADIYNINLGSEIPEKYMDYWENLKKTVYSTPLQVVSETQIEDENHPSFIIKDYDIKTAFDTVACCRVTYPSNAKKGSLKLKMHYMGYGVYGCSTLAQDGFMNVSTNTHSIPNGQTPEFYEKYHKEHLNNYGLDKQQNACAETSYWNLVFARNFQVLKFFMQNELINGKDYIFTGSSQGGMQACIMAAHSGVATRCYADLSWLCDLGGKDKYARIPGWNIGNMSGIRHFDTAIAARYLKCPIEMNAGLGDYCCQPSGQMAMYNGITAPKKLTFYQNTGHTTDYPNNPSYTIQQK